MRRGEQDVPGIVSNLPTLTFLCRLQEQGKEAELSVQPVSYEDSASKIQTLGEALALELHLWLQFNSYGSLSCL